MTAPSAMAWAQASASRAGMAAPGGEGGADGGVEGAVDGAGSAAGGLNSLEQVDDDGLGGVLGDVPALYFDFHGDSFWHLGMQGHDSQREGRGSKAPAMRRLRPWRGLRCGDGAQGAGSSAAARGPREGRR